MRVTDGVEAQNVGISGVIGESDASVDQSAHHLDRGDRVGPTGFGPRRRGRQRAGGAVERGRVEQHRAQLVVTRAHGEGDGVRAVVAEEDAVLQIAEVATDRTARLGQVGIAVQAVEAREVHDARVLFVNREIHAEPTDPARHRRAAAERGHHQISVDRAVVRHHTRDERSAAVARGHQALDGRAVADGHVVEVEHDPTQGPLEGRSPASDCDQVLITGARIAIRHLDRRVVAEVHLGRARGQERFEHIGVVVAQQVAQPSQQCVRMANLGCAAAIPLERGIRRGGKRCGIPLDHRHAVSGPGQAQGRSEPTDTRADDHRMLRGGLGSGPIGHGSVLDSLDRSVKKIAMARAGVAIPNWVWLAVSSLVSRVLTA